MKRAALVMQVVGGVVVAACSGTPGSGFADSGLPGASGIIVVGGASSSASTIIDTNADGGRVLMGTDSGMTMSSSAGSGTGPCPFTSGTKDNDGDGWSPADGDCNDCNKLINPGAYDIPGNGVDEDCDGTPDNAVTDCDSTLTSVATTAGSDGAKALDICKTTTAAAALPMRTWGLISADYVLPDGSSAPSQTGQDGDGDQCSYSSAAFGLGFGILGPKFGTSNSTQHGQHMLGLSTGTARQPSDPGFSDPSGAGGGVGIPGYDKCFSSGAPSGFPGQTPACPGITFGAAHDGASLRVVIRVPTNAVTMSFDSNFFSHEFPDYVCSAYNDTYVVIMTPAPSGEKASANNNIAFDANDNVISVNAGFLTVCDPSAVPGYACAEGVGKLASTGFSQNDSPDMEDHASTDWLTTTVSVASLAGQEITLLFAIWDSTDGYLDSTVLVDNLSWTFASTPSDIPPTTAPPSTVPISK